MMARLVGRLAVATAAMALMYGMGQAAELNSAAVIYKLPDQIKWNENPNAGNANAVLYGDPTKPGLYISSSSNGTPGI